MANLFKPVLTIEHAVLYLQNGYIASPNWTNMTENKSTLSLFSKDNYMWMLAGAVVIIIGMLQ